MNCQPPMIKFKIPYFRLKLQKQFLMFLNANQPNKMIKKYNNFGILTSQALFIEVNLKSESNMKTNTRIYKLISYLLILFILLAVFMLNMTFASKIPNTILLAIRITLIASFFGLWRFFHEKKHEYSNCQYKAFLYLA